MMTASYSPDDNKLRLYSTSRLDKELYTRVRAAGFIWAPKQDLFVAPMWTPNREDLLIELCGEIGDEDTSLVDRAEQRAERFEDYSEARAGDASRAHEAVSAIADNIPLGQPILVGHHSERHARKDAEKIQNGMRKAVKMWETSQYWQQRAAGAIRHAKYKELPAVRARRIKGLEADERKQKSYKDQGEAAIKAWSRTDVELTQTRAESLAGITRVYVIEEGSPSPVSLWSMLHDGKLTVELAAQKAIQAAERQIAGANRWLTHLGNRLAYERAMLADSGGTVADRNKPEKGGACRCWASPGYGKGWSYIQKVNKVSVTVLDNWGNSGPNFTRTIPFDKLKGIMCAADVQAAKDAGRLMEDAHKTGFYLADVPPETHTEKQEAAEVLPPPASDNKETFEAMKETLRAGVQVVTANQLFPTPPDLADRMVEEADIRPGQDVLEPSAGTGAIIDAIRRKSNHGSVITAVETNYQLSQRLKTVDCLGSEHVHQADFLECNGNLGKFDRILMNPPFERGDDIKHILHAITFLKPNGRLVAICANGPRQNEKLRPLVEQYGGTWEPLPADTFRESGTGVNTVLLAFTLPENGTSST